jgi:hypothetical protein
MGLQTRDRFPVPIKVTVTIVSLTVLVLVASNASSQSDSSAYTFRDLSVTYATTPVLDTLDISHGRIHYSVGWAMENFPGTHNCVWRVYDDSNRLIGERSAFLTTMQASYDSPSYTDVPISGEPASADVSCDERRLDDPNGRYRFSEVAASASSDRRASVDVEARTEWLGVGKPTPQTCSITVTDPNGQQLFTDTVNYFSLAPGVSPITFHVGPKELSKKPGDASISCRGIGP